MNDISVSVRVTSLMYWFASSNCGFNLVDDVITRLAGQVSDNDMVIELCKLLIRTDQPFICLLSV